MCTAVTATMYVVQGVSLKVAPGTVVALLGRNGMGKTTLVHTIMGLVRARAGKISYDKTTSPTCPLTKSLPWVCPLCPRAGVYSPP